MIRGTTIKRLPPPLKSKKTSCAVILNGVKNLEVSETVDGSANLEMLRVAQHDKTRRGDASLSLSMT